MTPVASQRLHEGALFAVATAARIAYLLVARPPLESYYLALADNLVSTAVFGFDGVRTTAFEPVYPAVLVIGRLLFGDRTLLIQILLSCIAAFGAPLLYRLALQLTASRRVAIAAALIFALHPLLVRQASAATDLSLTTTLTVAFAAAFVATRDVRSAVVAGICLGLTVLTRSMVLPVVVLGGAILLVRGQWREMLAMAGVALACAAPMAARNYTLSGSPWPGRSGINLYIGNSPYTAALLPTYDLDLLEPEAYEQFVRARPDVHPDDPRFAAEFDVFLTAQAVTFMREHKSRTLRQKLLNVAYLFSPRITPFDVAGVNTRVRIEGDRVIAVEHSVARRTSEIAAHAVTALVLLVGCAAGVYLRRRELHRDAILWAIAATFVAVNALYVPATRYTAPMQFVLIFYSAVALARLREGPADCGRLSVATSAITASQTMFRKARLCGYASRRRGTSRTSRVATLN